MKACKIFGGFFVWFGIILLFASCRSSPGQNHEKPLDFEEVLVQEGSFLFGYESGIAQFPFAYSVTVNSFFISKYEVTQAQYETVMGYNPSSFSGSVNLPVESVT